MKSNLINIVGQRNIHRHVDTERRSVTGRAEMIDTATAAEVTVAVNIPEEIRGSGGLTTTHIRQRVRRWDILEETEVSFYESF